jgi:hypothetical protein
MPVRVFTLAEANDLVPVVQKHLCGLQESVRSVSACRDSLAVLDVIGGGRVQSPEHREYVQVRARLEAEIHRYQERIEDFQKLGCILKSIDPGLVDFYGLREGRLIFLCWKLGEKRIGHWHEVNAGFRGRRPVAEL